jgi:hypothetical protein
MDKGFFILAKWKKITQTFKLQHNSVCNVPPYVGRVVTHV